MKVEETLRKIKESAKIVDEFIFSNFDKLHKDLYEASLHYFKAGGKRIRPYLALTSYKLYRDDIERVLPFAAGLEVLHTFTLIHDDIMDNDDIRRGLPTVHRVWGVPMAILAGDYLFAKVFDLASKADVEPEIIVRVLRVLSETTITLCDGQAYDMWFERKDDVSVDEYYDMIRKKTGALIKASAEIGGIVGGGSEEDIRNLGEFGEKIGVAFQIIDDVIGLVGEEKVTGKPKGSDVREGKKTLPILYALERLEGEDKKFLMSILKKERTFSDEEIEKAISLIEKTGAIDYSRELAKKIYSEAIQALNRLPDKPAKKDLRELAYVIVERNF